MVATALTEFWEGTVVVAGKAPAVELLPNAAAHKTNCEYPVPNLAVVEFPVKPVRYIPAGMMTAPCDELAFIVLVDAVIAPESKTRVATVEVTEGNEYRPKSYLSVLVSMVVRANWIWLACTAVGM